MQSIKVPSVGFQGAPGVDHVGSEGLEEGEGCDGEGGDGEGAGGDPGSAREQTVLSSGMDAYLLN